MGLPPLGYATGHAGLSWTLPTHSTMFRDGELLGEVDHHALGMTEQPDASARYRFEQTTEGDFDDLSTRTATALTFSSARPAGDVRETLPVITVHFGEPAAGKVPVDVRDGVGRPVVARDLAVAFSADDGKTWKPAAGT